MRQQQRTTLLVVILLLLSWLLGSKGVAQQDDDQAIHEALKKLLLTESEINEILGGVWILDQLGRLPVAKEAELGNAVSAFGIYLKRGRTRDDISRLVGVLLQHPSEEAAKDLFNKGLISAVEPDNPVDLPAEVVKPVQEALKDVADDIQFFKYEDKEETLGLAFRKGRQVGVFRAKLTPEQFISLARNQIELLVKGRS